MNRPLFGLGPFEAKRPDFGQSTRSVRELPRGLNRPDVGLLWDKALGNSLVKMGLAAGRSKPTSTIWGCLMLKLYYIYIYIHVFFFFFGGGGWVGGGFEGQPKENRSQFGDSVKQSHTHKGGENGKKGLPPNKNVSGVLYPSVAKVKG